MKAFISIDLEGLPFIVIPGHLSLKGSLYSEAREIATKIALIVADELNKNGFDEILIADSHGPMVNLKVDKLPEYVEIVRGNPRPVSMVAGVEEDCDVAIFLGYHSKFGTAKSTFDHTYSSRSIHKFVINGVPVSEFLLNSYAAGFYNVPVILVAGDAQLLKDDVEQHTPWVETVVFKQSLSRVSAKSPSMIKIEADLREAITKAVVNFKENKVQPLKTEEPVKASISFIVSHFADVAELLPIVERTDGLTVEYPANNIIEAYKIFQVLVYAASGVAGLLEWLQ
ncbi:MAG: M55 family metallopeptidase [Candidatus Heimdallarchaeota archaeon]|nr:MAG: M55 family metallopeptidase [Candidatus Heimdallarchaeota archaeon]